MPVGSNMEPNLLLYATYYHSLGMNVAPIEGCAERDHSYKVPARNSQWRQYHNERQSDSYILSKDWKSASGLGLITGYNQYRAIDIDNLYYETWFCQVMGLDAHEEYDIAWRHKSRVFLKDCLKLLGLPEDYPWIVNSGSGVGFHIIFKADDIDGFESDNTPYSPNPEQVVRDVECGLLRNFACMELSWNFFLVLPPSKSEDGITYEFINGALPTKMPLKVSTDSINNLLNYFCGSLQTCPFEYNGKKVNLSYIAKKVNINDHSFNFSTCVPVDDDFNWLEDCTSDDAKNTLSVKYIIGEKYNRNKARNLLENNECALAKLNLASLIACGYFDGVYSDVENLLNDLPLIEGIDFAYIEYVKELAEQNCTKEPYYLFFDTETIGLPRNYKAPVTDSDNWPRLIQLSWIVTDTDGKSISEKNALIRPNGFKIPLDVSKLTGITTEKALNEGFDITEVLMEFLSDFEKVNTIVGHNIDFDLNIVRAEFYRLKIKENLEAKPSVCTMKSSTDFCKLPGYYGYRFPKLQVLYKKLFGEEFNNAHNAASDVAATRRCFFELLKRGIIITKNQI